MDKVKAIEVLKPLVESYVDHANITMKEEDDDIADALEMAVEALRTLDVPDTNVGDTISRQSAIDAINKLVDRFERILRDIRETNEDESVCGLCEYDGAFIGQSGDWCNECPGFDKADCFKLSDERRKKWLKELDLPSAQPETCEGCKHLGKWENEVEYGYPSPCTRCKRRVEDYYER